MSIICTDTCLQTLSPLDICTIDNVYRHMAMQMVFTARRYASAVLAVIVCLSVRLSVCPSQVGVVQRWLNLGSD